MKIGLALVFALVLGVFAAWASSGDLKFNPASFEAEALVPALAPIERATTLAQYRDADGVRSTMIVLSMSDDRVKGIDLRELGAVGGEDPFKALAEADLALIGRGAPIGGGPIGGGAAGRRAMLSVPIAALLSAGSDGERHIGTGTNFPEHAEEANSGSIFQFPKFGHATPARTQVKAEKGILLDYEVEICVRFDRDIGSIEDFDKAVKGIFLCGDFTNRNALVYLADPDNLASGTGFSDAKSGPDFFPTGPFLVVPKDWQAFVDDVRMTTQINGAARQDARGGEMTLDFRQLAEKALADMRALRFLYRDRFVRLAPDGRIGQSATLMSGTSEGTIFTPPTRADIIEGLLAYIGNGGPFGGADLMTSVRRTFIDNELESGHYLKPGDLVVHRSNSLGDIEIRVTD